jgi:4-amino-4-deoxy-L-arabinose transferase-like glycosyltransferase
VIVHLSILIYLVVLAVLVEVYRFNPPVATSLGFCVATIFNYGFQYHLTFRAKGSHAKIFLRYIVVTVSMMGLNAAFFWCLTERWEIPYIYAQMLATVVIMFCNFAINRVYTFNTMLEHEGIIMNTINKQKLFLIFLLAFVLRLTVFLIFRPWDIQVQAESILVGDAPGYHKLAECIVDHFTFCGETFRTPGYPFFIAVFYEFFGAKPWVVLFAQILVDLVTIYYVLRIGEMVFSRRVGIIAATFLAIDPNSIFATANLYSDSLFVTFLSASLYFYLRGLKLGERRSFLTAGGLLALSALVRPVAQYYFLILLLFALLWPTKNLVIRIKYGLLYGLAFAITISPWLYRNYTLYDTIKLSSVQGENLLFWQVATTRAWEMHQSLEATAAEFMAQAKALGYSEGGNPFANEAIAQKIAVQYIKTHPQVYASRLISGMIHTFINLNSENIIVKRLGGLPMVLPPRDIVNESDFKRISNFFRSSLPKIASGLIGLILLFTAYLTFLLGSYVLIKRHQLAILTMFAVSIMYFAVASGPIGQVRFRLPITPFYLLVGAVYIDQFLNRRASRVAASFQGRKA